MHYLHPRFCHSANKYCLLKALQSTFHAQYPVTAQPRRATYRSYSDLSSQNAPAEPAHPEEGSTLETERIAVPLPSKKSMNRPWIPEPNHDSDIHVNSLEDTLEAHRATNLAFRIRKIEHSPSLLDVTYKRLRQTVDIPKSAVQIDHQNAGINQGDVVPEQKVERGFPNLSLARFPLVDEKEAILAESHAKQKDKNEYLGRNVLLRSEYKADISHALDTRSPWLKVDAEGRLEYDPFLRLHEEILGYEDLMQLDHDEHSAREGLVNAVKTVTERHISGTQLEVFGSTVTGLMLPFSDIDLRIIDPAAEESVTVRGPNKQIRQTLLKKLRSLFRVFSFQRQLQGLEFRYGRVPVVVAKHRKTGLEIQVSTKIDLLTSQEYVKNYLVEYPTLRPLFVVIKQMLHIRGLTDVYAGGLGSYSIIMMIVAYLKLHPPLRLDHAPLGRLLRGFLSFYAEFDTYKFGLSIEPPEWFNKYPSTGKPVRALKEAIALDPVLQGRQKICVIQEAQPYLLCIQDPANALNDLGSKCYAIKHIQKTFAVAVRNLDECISIWENNQPKTSPPPIMQSKSDDQLQGGGSAAASEEASESIEYTAIKEAGLLWPIVGGVYSQWFRRRLRVRLYGRNIAKGPKESADRNPDFNELERLLRAYDHGDSVAGPSHLKQTRKKAKRQKRQKRSRNHGSPSPETAQAEDSTPREGTTLPQQQEEMSAEDISSEDISSEDISTEEAGSEEMSSEEMSPEKINSDKTSSEEINSEDTTDSEDAIDSEDATDSETQSPTTPSKTHKMQDF